MQVQIYDKKSHSKNVCNCSSKNTNLDAPLDTLAQLAKVVLYKRARSKYISSNIAIKLADLHTNMEKSYWNTYHCTNTLVQDGKKVTSRYCGNRWCLTCNRIRTAKLIIGYKEPLSKLEDPQFVTLTIPNVPGNDLQKTIEAMMKTFKKIMKTFSKRGTPIIGIRKLEVTMNSFTGLFHPHFHLQVQGHQIAEDIVLEWLKHNPSANIKAQDIREANGNSTMELFKYFTKIVSNKVIDTRGLDIIFQAMKGKRTFQPMGIKKDVSEDIEELQAEIYADLEERETMWSWIENDWYDVKTGEELTGYIPSENVCNLIKSIK